MDRVIPLIFRDGIVRQFIVRLVVDAITHTFVSTTHAEAVRIMASFQTDVEKPVAFTTAVENLLADILLLGATSRRQQDGGRVPTQHWIVLVTEVFVRVLIKDIKKYINVNFFYVFI